MEYREGLEGVILEKRGVEESGHDDARRTITAPINGDLPFNIVQVKFADVKGENVQLGGHYHTYWEAFYLRRGNATVILEHIDTGRGMEVLMGPQHLLTIPPRIAHKVSIEAHSVLVGFTEESYISPAHNDRKYSKWEKK